jgi:hypothetical protein
MRWESYSPRFGVSSVYDSFVFLGHTLHVPNERAAISAVFLSHVHPATLVRALDSDR